MSLTATGVGSGLDIEGLVTKLMEAERTPKEQRLLTREADITSDISGLASLKGALSELQTSLSSANSLGTFNKRNVSSDQSSALTVAASSGASLADYSVNVQSLAAAQSLAVRSSFSSLNESVGTGTLEFTFGTTSYTPHETDNANDTYDGFVAKAGTTSASVTIDSSNNTLSGVRDAINQANFGVTAAIVSDGNGYRLLISSNSTGAENSLQVSVTDAGDGNHTDGSGLSRLAFNGSAGAANVYQTVAGADATFTVNGLSLTSASNTVSNVIDGLTLTLKAATTGAAKVSVTDNTDGIKTAINTFVAGYNSWLDTLDGLTGYDFATQKGGALQGDFSALSISSQIRNTLSAAVNGYSGSYHRLAELGVSALSSGKLSVDDAKLSTALAADFDNVTAVFTRFADASSGSGISSVSATDSVAVGSYVIAVSSLASSGSKTSSVLSAPLTISGANDALILTVDGTASGTITLTNQAYASLSAFATELQTQINADSTLRLAGKAVTVSVADSKLVITSNSVGSDSTVRLGNADSDTTLTTLGFDTVTSSNGADLVGTINGVAGTAEGNILTGAAGSGSVGLSVAISSTAGGTVTVSQGVLDQLDDLLTSMLGTNNSLDLRIDSLEDRIDEIGEQREALSARMDALELRYRRQFNALDSLVNQLTSTGSYVADQLANIPIPGKTKK